MLKICLVIAVVAATASGQCDDGFLPFGHSCYALQTSSKSFDAHRLDCGSREGWIVSISSAAENDFVKQMLQDVCFDACDMFIGLVRNNGQFTNWQDGTPFGGTAHSNWNDGEPNNFADSENCAEMVQDTGQWNDNLCSANRLAMCEKNQQSWCGSWSQFGECCYRPLGAKSFDRHRSDCQNRSGELVSISSQVENDFVQNMVSTISPAYVGLRRDSAGLFSSWLDGKPLGGAAFSNWDTNEP